MRSSFHFFLALSVGLLPVLSWADEAVESELPPSVVATANRDTGAAADATTESGELLQTSTTDVFMHRDNLPVSEEKEYLVEILNTLEQPEISVAQWLNFLTYLPLGLRTANEKLQATPQDKTWLIKNQHENWTGAHMSALAFASAGVLVVLLSRSITETSWVARQFSGALSGAGKLAGLAGGVVVGKIVAVAFGAGLILWSGGIPFLIHEGILHKSWQEGPLVGFETAPLNGNCGIQFRSDAPYRLSYLLVDCAMHDVSSMQIEGQILLPTDTRGFRVVFNDRTYAFNHTAQKFLETKVIR